jgi:formylglycine-generating enzyme
MITLFTILFSRMKGVAAMNRLAVMLSIFLCANVFSADVSLKGKITKGGSDPVSGARVSLKNYPRLAAFSGSDGTFELKGSTGTLAGPWVKTENGIAIRSMKNGAGIVVRTALKQSNVKVDVFQLNGGLLASKTFTCAIPEYAVPLAKAGSGALIVKVAAGNEHRIFKTFAGTGNSYAVASDSRVNSRGLAKTSASVSDSIVVFNQGFRTGLLAIQSYDKTDLAISLTATKLWTPSAALDRSKSMIKIMAKDYEFEMGQPDALIEGIDSSTSTPWAGSELPPHTVSFAHDFWMDTTEVTQSEFDSLMKKNYPSYTKPLWDARYGLGSNYPANIVNWSSAALFCNARSKSEGLADTVYAYKSISGLPGTMACLLKTVTVNTASKAYRLPTEAEWEYACRGGATTDFFWGKDYAYYKTASSFADVDSYAVWKKNSFDKGTGNPGFGPHIVASTIPNKYGLYDIAGNVSEWCHDDFNDYQWGSTTDSAGQIKTDFHALRGGHWATDVAFLRPASRAFNEGGDYSHFLKGFRLVRTAD